MNGLIFCLAFLGIILILQRIFSVFILTLVQVAQGIIPIGSDFTIILL